MIIKEVITRECCQQKDLQQISGSKLHRTAIYECKYCKQKWEWYKGIDGSGNWDYDLKKVK